MKPLLLEELVRAEGLWRSAIRYTDPLFQDMPVETVDPDPFNRRHWMFATDNNKVMAHVYKPDYVLKKFEEVVAPMFERAYGFSVRRADKKHFALRLIEDTLNYLLFHELFHPTKCPKSQIDREKFDVALKRGIQKAEPALTDRDLVNKAGNVRNAMWDLLIDTFFRHYSTGNSEYASAIRRELSSRRYSIGGNSVTELPDGIITTWDIVEVSDTKKFTTLFYPITRAMYGLLFCNDPELRRDVFNYFRKKIEPHIYDWTDNKEGVITDDDLRDAVVGSLSGTVRYLTSLELSEVGIDKKRFLSDVETLYDHRENRQGSAARAGVVEGITRINMLPELRYSSVEGIIESLARYISKDKEEKRDGANVSGSGEGDGQTSPTQAGGGAEEVLQSLINQGEANDSMVSSIANDHSAPFNVRNQRLRNLAIDEHYKRHATPLPVKGPTLGTEATSAGKKMEAVKIGERYITPQEVAQLDLGEIMVFQIKTGHQCLVEISGHQYRLDLYEWREVDIPDIAHTKTGIILPDNIIFRVDSSGSMTNGNYVGSGDRYDGLMHVVYGITKAVASAAKEMRTDINVVTVNYSRSGSTKVSEAIELQTFYDTPNNDAKAVLLNPQCGLTYHDLPAYQGAHAKCKEGKTIDIIVTDGDLDNRHDESQREIERILDDESNIVIYVSIFNQGNFANRIETLAKTRSNLIYKYVSDLAELQRAAHEIIIQYKEGMA